MFRRRKPPEDFSLAPGPCDRPGIAGWACGLALALLLSLAAKADDAAPPLFISIPHVDRPLTLEELLGGDASRRAAVVKDFVQHDPHEGEPASQETTAYLAFDAKQLYVGFVCLDRDPQNIRAHVTRRDAIWGDDHVGVMIDTYYDHRRGYSFAVNALGIQSDSLVSELQGEDESFDTLWHSEGRLTEHGYVALLSIPFKSLRFSPDRQQTWGIILSRSIPRDDEFSTWPAISRKVSGWLVQEAEARGIEDISPGKNAQVVPYGFFSSRRFLDKETNQFRRERMSERLGLDAKWVMGSNLTLDATVNPDFSQVESDQPQITVNRRFEVFFPEKRPFFMENSNYFDTPISVLFTRRIADPQFGVKLTGKLGPYTVAALAADDRAPGESVAPEDPSFGQRAFFNVFRLSRDIHRESALGFIWSDREFLNSFNRVLGADGRWKFSRTTGLGFQVLKSFSRDLEGTPKQGMAIYAGLDHFSQHWNYFLGYNDRSPDFEIASGFVPRVDYRSLGGRLGYVFRPESGWVVALQPFVFGNVLFDPRNVRQDYYASPGLWVEFARATSASGHFAYKRERFEGIDFLRRNYEVGLHTRRSRWFSAHLFYEWKQQINYEPADGRSPYLGQGDELSLGFTVRPTARLAVEHTLLESRLLTLEESRNIFNNNIFRSKWNYQFTPRLSLRVIGQYANVLPSPELSSLEYAKNLAGDVLVTYLVHPGTALYVGYSNMLENYNRLALAQGDALERARTGLLSTAAGLFVKLSYVYQF